MKATLLILLAAGPIGSIDIVYFHLWKFRLYSRRQSQREEIAHLVRGAVFPAGVLLLLIGRPDGAWFWVLLGLFALDFVNTIIDVVSEPASRAPIGVPKAELVVHYTGATMMGAALTTYIAYGWANRTNATAFTPYPPGELPNLVIASAILAVVVGTLLLVVESSLFIRSVRQRAAAGTATTSSHSVAS